MANPDGSGRGAREVSGVYPASMRPCVSEEFVAALAAYALQMDSGELALACVHLSHSADRDRIPAASAVILRWLAQHFDEAACALDESPGSLPDVAESTGEAAAVLSRLLDEWRRATPPVRVSARGAVDGE
jgi:hypothetical protein